MVSSASNEAPPATNIVGMRGQDMNGVYEPRQGNGARPASLSSSQSSSPSSSADGVDSSKASSRNKFFEDAPTPIMSNRGSPPQNPPPLDLAISALLVTDGPSNGGRRKEDELVHRKTAVARFSSMNAKPILVNRAPVPSPDMLPPEVRPRGLLMEQQPSRAVGQYWYRKRLAPTNRVLPPALADSGTMPALSLTDAGTNDSVVPILPLSAVASKFFMQRLLIAVRGQLRRAAASNNNYLRLAPPSMGRGDPYGRTASLGASFSPEYSSRYGNGTGKVRGIPNYGQTCFLNSILQSLATLEPIIVYLEKIIQISEAWPLDDDQDEPTKDDQSLCKLLLHLLHSINGNTEDIAKIDPRSLLQSVGSKYPQFRAKFGFSSVGREQQDAEEFLQALLGAIVDDAGIDVITGIGDSCGQNQFNDAVEGDEILTVVSGVRERERTEAGFVTAGHSSSMDSACGSPLKDPAEAPLLFDEKKQDEHVLRASEDTSLRALNYAETIDTPNGDHAESIGGTFAADQNCLSAAMRMMLTSTSSITPSPLCGWIGSALQCRDCKHVRPIQNAPFLDIPVVPTAVSSYLSGRHGQHPGQPPQKYSSTKVGPPCLLEECLEEFTSVERVYDVECRCCMQNQEISSLEEEAEMLRGAVAALQSRRKRNVRSGKEDVASENPGIHLRHELEVLESKISALKSASPDEEGTLERILAPLSSVDGASPPLEIHRSPAFKCLLLTRLPSVLCIHIQRRFYDPVVNRMTKTAQHVVFPEYLDVGPYCAYGENTGCQSPWAGSGTSKPKSGEQEPRSAINYRLRSIVEHSGGAFSGHYVSFRRDPESGRWLYISDSTVKTVDWKTVQNCQAYMLFYEAL